MRGLYSLGLVALLLVLAGSSAQADVVDGGLYGLAPRSGPSKETDVILIDPTDGSWTVVTNYAGIEFHSIEIAGNGTVYATGTWDEGGADTNLYTLDLSAGTYASVGMFGTDLYFGGLSMSSDGTLYGSASDLVENDLYTLNTSTGAASSIAAFNPVPGGGIGGFGFNVDGSLLYGVEFGGGLYTIDKSTAAVTHLGGSTNGLTALAVNPADGVIYGNVTSAVSGAETLVRISPIDGSTTVVNTMVVGDLTSLTFANLSAVPELSVVPEPSGLWVTAVLLAMTMRRRRRAIEETTKICPSMLAQKAARAQL